MTNSLSRWREGHAFSHGLLTKLLIGKTYLDALPSNLSDEWLAVLGRDLRQYEAFMRHVDRSGFDCSRTMLILAHIFRERGKLDENETTTCLVLAGDNMFQEYQTLLEREIVGRVLDFKFPIDSAAYIEIVDSKIRKAFPSRNFATRPLSTFHPTDSNSP
ncbi:MAG: hypothetical protein ABI702_15835 [Burkholderiales bacterium]